MVRKSTKRKAYLTPNEVAEMLMVSPTTVRQWASEGKLDSLTTPGGHRRFLRSEIERFSQTQGLTLQLPGGEKTRILIVDDNTDISDYLTELFRRVDTPVQTKAADNGFDAGRLIQSFQPHVVLLDLMLPGIDGFEVCESIKQDPSSKAIRVIAMTGFYDDENVKRIMAAGAETCLRKPFSYEDVLSAIGLRISND